MTKDIKTQGSAGQLFVSSFHKKDSPCLQVQLLLNSFLNQSSTTLFTRTMYLSAFSIVLAFLVFLNLLQSVLLQSTTGLHRAGDGKTFLKSLGRNRDADGDLDGSLSLEKMPSKLTKRIPQMDQSSDSENVNQVHSASSRPNQHLHKRSAYNQDSSPTRSTSSARHDLFSPTNKQNSVTANNAIIKRQEINQNELSSDDPVRSVPWALDTGKFSACVRNDSNKATWFVRTTTPKP